MSRERVERGERDEESKEEEKRELERVARAEKRTLGYLVQKLRGREIQEGWQ